MRKLLSTSLFLLLLVIVWPKLAVASSPLLIEANSFGQWDIANGVFYGEGDVEIEFDGVWLGGERFYYDDDAKELYLEGNVVLRQDGQEVSGESLSYNLDTMQGEFNQIRAEFEADNVEGPIFVFGDQVAIDGNDYHIADGKITTCDLSEPHYHVAVTKIEVYPGNRMVIRNVIFYEGRIPLFYWPYLSIPLDGSSDFDFTLPEIGYSAEDGYYIKNRYNYFFSENTHGSLLYDYFTRQGLGLGLDHNYAVGLLGAGSIGLYYLPAAHRQHVNAELNHEIETSNLIFRTNNRYFQDAISGVMKVERETRNSLNYRTDSIQASGSFNYKQEQATSIKESWSASGRWNQNITPDWRLNLSSNVRAEDSTQIINNLAETTYRLSDHTLGLAVQQRYNPDVLESDTAPAWRSINRLPEFTWQWRNPGLFDYHFGGRFELGVGRFTEYPSAVDSYRVAPRLEMSTRTWNPSFGPTFRYSGGLAGYYYEESFSQQLAHGRVSLSHRFTQNLSLSANYNIQEVWGETPFKFDQQSKRNSLTGSLSYSNRPWTLSVRSGYNFVTEQYNNVVSQINWNDGQGLNLSLTHNYNINNMVPGNLVGLFNYRPHEDLIVRLGTRYQLNNQRFERVDGQILIDLTETINLRYDAIYEPINQRFTKGDLAVLVDLHCRELSFSYNQVRQDFRVQYSINAFPSLPIGYSSDDGISLFQMSDLQELLDIND